MNEHENFEPVSLRKIILLTVALAILGGSTAALAGSHVSSMIVYAVGARQS